MAKDKKEKIDKMLYEYLCEACTGVAIKTTNLMLGVSINCAACGELIELNDKKRYRKIKS